MKTTEIVTAHNVVIQYELAPLMSRALALLLDIVIIFFYALLVLLVVSLMATSFTLGNAYTSESAIYLFYALFMLPAFFYSFWMEAFFGGQTVGKMALGIRVVNISGSTPGMGELFLRWSMRLLDIWMSIGALAAIVSSASEKGQRFGGIVSNTCIIKLQPSTQYSIKDILTIKSKKDYEPQYPQVVQLTDDDMLLIKNSIERLRKYPNSRHKELIVQLAQTAADKLSISGIPKNKVSFLKTLLQDYIVLTRS